MRSVFVGALTLIMLAASMISCSDNSKNKKQEKPPVPASVAKSVKKNLPVVIQAIGNVSAYTTVQVKPLIAGTITEVHIGDGDEVKEGDLLFTIDPRPFQAAMSEAKARLEKDQVQLKKAQNDLKRYSDLVEKRVISNEQFEQAQTNVDSISSSIRLNEALLEKVKLDLNYCYIRSPITGKAGTVMANRGNTVKANPDNPLLVIYQIKPIYIDFTAPESRFGEISAKLRNSLQVQAFISSAFSDALPPAGTSSPNLPPAFGQSLNDGPPETGTLTYIDNAVDKTTGTIKLKATFPNNDKRLWPGQFVRCSLTLGIKSDAVVVPSSAVQIGQQGHYVFTLNQDMQVESKNVVIGDIIEGETEIVRGLNGGETVVTDGHLRLTPGSVVKLRDASSGNGTAKKESANPGNSTAPQKKPEAK